MSIRTLAALTLLAATPLFAGTLTYANRSTGADRQLILRRDGTRLVIADRGSRTVLAGAPAATTDRVVIHGAAGEHDDTLTIDLTQPITLAGGIDYDGGAAGWDELVLQGGFARDQKITQLTPHDGVLDIDGLVIRYRNLEPITDTVAAANYLIVGTAGSDGVSITDGPAGTTTISSASFESVTFANKTNVVFDGLGGFDTVHFNNPNPATGLVSFIVTNVGSAHQTAPIAYPSFGVSATGAVSLQDDANDVDRVEITSQTGPFVVFTDADDLIVGGVSPALAGMRVVQTGSVSVAALGGDLVLDDTDAAEILKAGDSSGTVGLSAGGDIRVAVDRRAAIAPAGSVFLQSIGDTLLGTVGPTFANDIRAAVEVNMTVIGSLVVGGLTTVISDAFGQNSGGDLIAFFNGLLTQTGGGRFVAGGTAEADVQLWSGTGSLEFLGTVVGAESASGDVRLLGRGLTIAPTSGLTAPLGEVEVVGHGMVLGAVVDVPDFPMELSDAELDRIFAPVVVIHANTIASDARDVTQPITFTTGTELILRAFDYWTAVGPGSLSAPVLTFEIPAFPTLTWNIAPTSIQMGAGVAIPYSGVTTLNARARVLSPNWAFPSDAEDTFNVTPSATTTINIDGHLPVPPASPGDVLDFNLTGVVNPVLTATLTATGYQGSLTSANRQPVNFEAIEQLVDAPVDLAVTKTDGATTAVAGTPLTYTIAVTNPAPIPVAGASVMDAFPADLTGVNWTCAPSAGSTCALGGSGSLNDTVTLAANGSVTYTVTGTISPSATGTLTNTATVTTPAGYTETNAVDNSATDTTTLTAEANLIVTKTAEVTNVDPGESLAYTITLRNAGPSDAQNVSLSDVLPAGMLFLSLFAPPEYSCVTPAPDTTGTVTCTRAVLPPSATADTFQLNVAVSLSAAPGPTANTVVATSATPDPSPENTATAALAIGAPIPALSTVMMLLLAALLGVVALRVIR